MNAHASRVARAYNRRGLTASQENDYVTTRIGATTVTVLGQSRRVLPSSQNVGKKRNGNERGLQRLPGRADKIAQDSDIGAVSADPARINGKAEALRKIQVDAGIIEFGQAESGSGQHAIQSGGIHGPRRPVPLPGAARQLVKLLPIAFVPRVHVRSIPAPLF